MASSLLGRVGEFDSTLESWQQYVESLGHFLDVNGIHDGNKKRSVLLSIMGPGTYKLLSSLIAPEKPGDKGFADLVKVLTDHYNPAPSEIIQQYKFHTRIQQSGESITKFVAELRSIAQDCKFGDTLNDLLKDRLVCGINDDSVQRRLLSEKALNFDSALDIATSMEAAKKSSDELQRQEPSQYINLQVVATDVGKTTLQTDADLGQPNVLAVVK